MDAQPTATDPDMPRLLTLAKGVFVRQEVDNMAWVDMGDHMLVVDALERPELEEEVFTAIRETLPDTPVRYVLNTHTHYDHVALNPAFTKRWGADIVNAKTRELPAEGVWFEGKARRVLMMPLPGCHTSEDCVVWLPEDRVLFVGDIFGWGLIPWDRPLTEAKRTELKTAYGRLLELGPEHVVPGHGPLCTGAELRRWLEYFAWLISSVKALDASLLSDVDTVAGRLPPPEDMQSWWRFCLWKHEDSLKKVARAVGRGALA